MPSRLKSHPLLGKKLFVIIAHPDDEGFLFSGTIWKNQRAGGRTTIVCATLGEKGTSHLKRPVTADQMKRIRHRELKAATRFIGVNRVHVLHLLDGHVNQHESRFLTSTRKLLQASKPNVIVSFGPDGLTGHRDHLTCWRVANRLSRAFKLPLYVATVPPQYRSKAAAWMVAGRVNSYYHKIQSYRKATVRVAIPAGLKARVLNHYVSQFNPKVRSGRIPATAARDFRRAEYFARVR